MPGKFLFNSFVWLKKYQRAVAVFLTSLFFCLSLIFYMALNRSNVEMLTMEQLILGKSAKINDVMSRLLFKTQTLSTIIMHNNGEVESFAQLASIIIDDPVILNVLIAPDGVVAEVYPLAGNEAVIGLDFFSEGAGNREAIRAKETGELVFGGPFYAVQGGQILVGRLPVFMDDPDGAKRFWGLVSVTLKYPQALAGIGLEELNTLGFNYEIWRENPDTNERQIIASSGHSHNNTNNYIERQVSIINAEWYFRIMSTNVWYKTPEIWIACIISICLSLLAATVIQSNHYLKELKSMLEKLSDSDPLTGIHNRRYFMKSADTLMCRLARSKSKSFIIILDLDYFKAINDEYGHQSGDVALQEVAMRVKGALRPYDLFARYGGEEFIIFVTEIEQASVMELAERIRLCIAETQVCVRNASIQVTASLGIAPATPCNELEAAIAFADKALYKAKEEGRNKAMFYCS